MNPKEESTYHKKIREILDECKTTGNWKGTAMLIASYAYEMDETIFNM